MNNLESCCNPRGRLSALCGRQLLSPGRTLGKHQANGRQYSQSDRNSEKGTPHAYGIGCDRRHFGCCRWWSVLSLSSPPEGSRTAPYSLDRSRILQCSRTFNALRAICKSRDPIQCKQDDVPVPPVRVCGQSCPRRGLVQAPQFGRDRPRLCIAAHGSDWRPLQTSCSVGRWEIRFNGLPARRERGPVS